MKAHRTLQTASTRVQELSIRYMKAFGTSPDHFYTYSAHAQVSYFFYSTTAESKIASSSWQWHSSTRHGHASRSTVPCVSRDVRQIPCDSHAHPTSTAQMRAADRSSKCRQMQPASRDETRSSFRTRYMHTAARLDHRTQPSDGLHRATALRLPACLAERLP